MQIFKSIKKTLLTTVSVITLMGSLYASEPIGSISEHTGEAYLTRDLEKDALVVSGAFVPDVLLNDTAETKNGRMVIKFLDDAALDMTEYTKAYLDTVYYDPDPSKSKMTMRFVQGTARFTSGRLGMVPKKNIDLSTPTAQIAVRGTDFTTTIDELGRTLVILLPDKFGGPSGIIDVFNDGVKNLPIVTVVILLTIALSASSINPVTSECLNGLLKVFNVFELYPLRLVVTAVSKSDLPKVVADEL